MKSNEALNSRQRKRVMNRIDVTIQKNSRSPVLILLIIAGVIAFFVGSQKSADNASSQEDVVVLVDSYGSANSVLLDELCDSRGVELRRFSSGDSMELVEPQISELFKTGAKSPPAMVSRIAGKTQCDVLSGDALVQLRGVLDDEQ